jgi:hypothetical protein
MSTAILLISVFSFRSLENESIESSMFIITESDSLLALEVALGLLFELGKFASVLSFFAKDDELTGDVHIFDASLFI